MKREDFNEFYTKVINRIMVEIEEYADEVCRGDKSLKRNRKVADRIYKYYQFKRDYIRCNYMSKKIEVSLDRHKVASCMVYAILRTKPFIINRLKDNIDEKVLLANEYLALYVALNIIEMYRLDDNRTDYGFQIAFPKTFHESDDPENDYENSFCRALYFLSMEDIKKYDVLAYSNVFFLLEKYTDINDLYFKEVQKHLSN